MNRLRSMSSNFEPDEDFILVRYPVVQASWLLLTGLGQGSSDSEANNTAPRSEISATPSESSSVLYGQESFSTFSTKVEALMIGLFPFAQVLDIKRMTGGGYNRIIGVHLSNHERYVLRIPRLHPRFNELRNQVAVLRHIKEHLTIQAPSVVHFDTTNQIRWVGLMLQCRIEGLPLSEYMSDLVSGDWKSLTDQVAYAMSQICSLTFPSIGILRAKAPGDLSALCFGLPPRLREPDYDSPASPFNNTLAYLKQCFDIHIDNSLLEDPNAIWTPSLMRRLKDAVVALAAKHPFSNRLSLLHEDYEARNFLVTKNESGRFVVQAILDFDGAVAAPIEAAWPFPHWLWTWGVREKEGISDLADAIRNLRRESKSKNILRTKLNTWFLGS
jgi:Phosphotransferase enzyme family